LGKNLNISRKIGPSFFLQHIKNKIIFSFVQFVATKNALKKKNSPPPSLVLLFLDPGSGMGKNQDPGSGIYIPDPQHCLEGKNDPQKYKKGSLFRADGFSCSLDVLYGGLGISKLQFCSKNINFLIKR
jgi:hypothetical protein